MNFQQLTQLIVEADLQGRPYPTGNRKYVDNDAYNRQSQLAKKYQDSGILKKLGYKLFNTQANKANQAIKNVNKADINALNAQSRMSDVDTGQAEQEHAVTSQNRTDMNIAKSQDEMKKYKAGQGQRDFDTQAKTKKIGDFTYALDPTGNPYLKWDGKDWVELSDADKQYFAKVGGKSAEEHAASAAQSQKDLATAQGNLNLTTQELQKALQAGQISKQQYDQQLAAAKAEIQKHSTAATTAQGEVAKIQAQLDAQLDAGKITQQQHDQQLQAAQAQTKAAEDKLKGYEDTAAKQAKAKAIEDAAIQIHAKNTGKSPQEAAADWSKVSPMDKLYIRKQAAKTVK